MPEKTLDEMIADINDILEDDDESLPDEGAPVGAAPTARGRPDSVEVSFNGEDFIPLYSEELMLGRRRRIDEPDMREAGAAAQGIVDQTLQAMNEDYGTMTLDEWYQTYGDRVSPLEFFDTIREQNDRWARSVPEPQCQPNSWAGLLYRLRSTLGNLMTGEVRRTAGSAPDWWTDEFPCSDTPNLPNPIAITALLARMYESPDPMAAVGSWNVLYDPENEAIPYDESQSETATIGEIHIALNERSRPNLFRVWGDIGVMRVITRTYANQVTEETDE